MSRSLILAITGGIAAYKSAALASQLVQQGHRVRAVMTPTATRFLGPPTLAALTGQSVVTELSDPQFPLGAHIELARDADLLCVAPASANFLAKAAQGIADDLLSTLYLCFTGTVLVAPAMNVEMWKHPAVTRNVQQLMQDGVKFIGPDEGWLSCRTSGAGRMSDPLVIADRITELLASGR